MPSTYTYQLTWNPNSTAGQAGEFDSAVWVKPDGTTVPDDQPFSIQKGDVLNFHIQGTFDPTQTYNMFIVFAAKHGRGNPRGTPFSSGSRPYSLLANTIAPSNNNTLLAIDTQGTDGTTKGAFEFTVTLRVGNSPVQNPPGNDYSRDPELDVTD